MSITYIPAQPNEYLWDLFAIDDRVSKSKSRIIAWALDDDNYDGESCRVLPVTFDGIMRSGTDQLLVVETPDGLTGLGFWGGSYDDIEEAATSLLRRVRQKQEDEARRTKKV